MTNLLKETITILEINGKSLSDIVWYGLKGQAMTSPITETFDGCYCSGFGTNEIPFVVGDNWWLERHEYDGSEWWEFKQLPKHPAVYTTGIALLAKD